MFDKNRVVKTLEIPAVHYSLQEDGAPVSAFTAWAVYDNNPHYKSVDLFVDNDSMTLDMDQAEKLVDALQYFLRIHAKQMMEADDVSSKGGR